MNPNKEVLLAVRVRSDEKEAFEAVARSQGLRISDLLRDYVRKEIKKARKIPAAETTLEAEVNAPPSA
jgi:antitoxin component of RelBE/YafQ-DinJ toxin-antitoxin module